MRPSSTRLGSIRSRSVRFGSAHGSIQLDSFWFGLTQFGSDHRVGSIRGSIRNDTIRFGGKVWLDSVPFDSVRPGSGRFFSIASDPFGFIPFDRI